MNKIKIIVCLKQVPDPEVSPSSFRIDSEANELIGEGVPPVINPYDESALEVGIRLKESHPQIKIIALSLGKKLARSVLMKALAVGADELYLIEELSLEPDTYITAFILAQAIKKIGFDLILTGRQSSDTNMGGVGLEIAEMLNIPAISWAQKVELINNNLKVTRITPEGYETIKGSLPALITISHEAGELRRPSLAQIHQAKNKPIYFLNLKELGIAQLPDSTIKLVQLRAPERERKCQIISSESPEQAGAMLVEILVAKRIIIP